jgi:hypothetical protein
LAIINTTAVPTSPGHLILSQWSNGDSGWSSGPPVARAVSTVGYVKGYFNSSDPARQLAASARCRDQTAAGAICSIPDQDITFGSLFSTFFGESANMTVNQTIYGKSGSKAVRLTLTKAAVFSTSFIMVTIMANMLI